MARKNGSIIGKNNVGSGVTYNASGMWSLNTIQQYNDNNNPLQSAVKLRVLCQGGGGGGAGSRTNEIRGGGGGGGGQKEGFFLLPPTGNIYVQVGSGGAGGVNYNPGQNGNPSYCGPWPTNSQLILANGGGAGQGYGGFGPPPTVYARNNGSGGGALGVNQTTVLPGRFGEGFPGGSGAGYPDALAAKGGGGGGAGGRGEDAPPTKGGDGGDGKTSDITGSNVTRGGGGGGSSFTGYSRGIGGPGGGGPGALATPTSSPSRNGTNGTDGLGGGGGGAGTSPGTSPWGTGTGGTGGDGCVIVRFPSSLSASYSSPLTAPQGTQTVSGSPLERYIEFRSGQGPVTFS